MKILSILIIALFLFAYTGTYSQEKKECVYTISLTKSDDNISVTLDTSFTTNKCLDFDVDSVLDNIWVKMEEFDIHFDIDIDSIIENTMVWIEDSMHHKKIEKHIISGFESFDFDKLDSSLSANMIIIQSKFDSLSKEEMWDIDIITDSIFHKEGHLIRILDSLELDLDPGNLHSDSLTKLIYLFDNKGHMTFDKTGDKDIIIKKAIKESGDGEEIEIIYELTDDFEEGTHKIVIIDDGNPQIITDSHKIIKYKTDKVELELFDLSVNEKSNYSDIMDIKGKEKLKIENLSIFPNPNNGKFKLSFSLQNSDPTIVTLFNSKGDKQFESEVLKKNGKFTTNINLKNLDQGDLILKISQGKKIKTKKILVK